jgi:serine/threonine protein phosphatase PrpC
MSRSLGDLVASTAGVICIPEITEITLEPDDKFLVIGSDGVFEFMSNEDVVRTIVPYWVKNDIPGACNAVMTEARARWMQVSAI